MKLKNYRISLLVIILILIFIGFPTFLNYEIENNLIPGLTSDRGCEFTIIDSIRIVNVINLKSDYQVIADYRLDNLPTGCLFKVTGNDPAYETISTDTKIDIGIGLPLTKGVIVQAIIYFLVLVKITGLNKQSLSQNTLNFQQHFSLQKIQLLDYFLINFLKLNRIY